MKKLILTSLCALALAACGGEQKSESATTPPPATATTSAASSTNANAKTYRVFSEATYVPFIMPSETGEISGFEVELLNEIGKKQGVSFTFQPHVWEGLLGLLAEDKADVIAGGTFVRDDRRDKMDFTEPYAESSTVLLVHKDSGINSFADANSDGKKIVFQYDTGAEKIAGEVFQRASISPSDTLWLGVKDVLSKKADGILGDAGPLSYYATKYKDQNLVIVTDPKMQKEFYGFAIKKGNSELKAILDKGLADAKADGTYDRLHDKWFNK